MLLRLRGGEVPDSLDPIATRAPARAADLVSEQRPAFSEDLRFFTAEAEPRKYSDVEASLQGHQMVQHMPGRFRVPEPHVLPKSLIIALGRPQDFRQSVNRSRLLDNMKRASQYHAGLIAYAFTRALARRAATLTGLEATRSGHSGDLSHAAAAWAWKQLREPLAFIYAPRLAETTRGAIQSGRLRCNKASRRVAKAETHLAVIAEVHDTDSAFL